MTYLHLFSVAILSTLGGPLAHGQDQPKATHVQWCEGALTLVDRAPANRVALRRAVDLAEHAVTDSLGTIDARRTETPSADELRLAEPHSAMVSANLERRTEVEAARELRRSQGRLARLRADLQKSSVEIPAFGRIDVGADDILKFLNDLPDEAQRARRAGATPTDPRPVDPRYALNTLASASGMGLLTFLGTLAMLKVPDPSGNINAFAGGVAGLSAVSLFQMISSHRPQLRSADDLIRIENHHNENLIGAQSAKIEGLSRLAAHADHAPLLFAHHGYAVFISERTQRDLIESIDGATPMQRRLFRVKREPFAALLDHVLYRNNEGQLELASTVRFVKSDRVPREWALFRTVSDLE